MAVAWPATTCPRCRSINRAEGRICPACGLLPALDNGAWELAGLGRRLAGAALFALVAMVTLAALMVLFAALVALSLSGGTDLTRGPALAVFALLLTPGFGYFVWWLAVAPQGQTPVKQVLGMRVVRADGTVAGLGTMLLRSAIGAQALNVVFPFYWLVDACWALWDRDRQCLHDKVAGTFVVRARPVELPAGGTAVAAQHPEPRWCAACGTSMAVGTRFCIVCGAQSAASSTLTRSDGCYH